LTQVFADHPLRERAVAVAAELADVAARMLSGNRAGSDAESKSAPQPVTEFDLRIETAVRKVLEREFPEHGVVGEEFPAHDPEAEFVWVIDPIDGTRAFAAGVPLFTTLIALCHRGKPVLGVIDASVTGDRWEGVEGLPSTLNGAPIRGTARVDLAGSIVAWGNPETVDPALAAGAERLRAGTAWRVYCSASYGYGRVASGSMDIAIEAGGDVTEIDLLAAIPVIQGAGGVCTDGFGAEIRLGGGASTFVAAGNPELHALALRTLRGG